MNRDFSSEFTFVSSRSGGPGGQHVNKVNTRIELRFSVQNSMILSHDEKELLFEKLTSKLTAEGDLIIISQSERTQLGNKRKCIEKFYALLQIAFKPVKKRIPSKPSRASKEKRLEGKKMQSKKKNMRKKPLK